MQDTPTSAMAIYKPRKHTLKLYNKVMGNYRIYYYRCVQKYCLTTSHNLKNISCQICTHPAATHDNFELVLVFCHKIG